MNDKAQAKEVYTLGLRAAKKIGRIDEEIRNLMGLARLERDPIERSELERQAINLKSNSRIVIDIGH
jgi:hypothetical protein